MNEQVNKQKIGARVLTDTEIKLILPTYERLKNQIEEIRKSNWTSEIKNDYQLQNSFLQIQKTNNIGILGARGTGKTSVIKTLMEYLSQQNQDNQNKITNFILPMVVPENMADSMNLMATILGLFKIEVDKIEQNNKKRDLECWEQKKSLVVSKYSELVKKFCYIQAEFRSVSIDQYTTESDYVRKSSEIYNSDIEFLSCFNQFISLLLDEGNCEKDALIFLFIDDIDLSTHRCIDVVKTLLSYISHPRIITILSGDLDTFEEALTVDFVRQENALVTGVLNENFLTQSSESLLKRKKILAYEYLKKIVPPVYRHNVKSWSLEDRGNYIIEEGTEFDTESDDEITKKGNSLSNLLTEVFIDYINAPLFQYYDFSSVEKIEKLESLPQVYHLFDKTSRGLNNVYNVLLETKKIFSENTDNSIIHFQQNKLLLETIVASNSRLSQYRTVLFEQVIKFGVDFESTSISCENFYGFINGMGFDVATNESEKKRNEIQIKNAMERFQLFLFLDFSVRILRKTNILSDDYYIDLKRNVIVDMINMPSISGSMITYSSRMIEVEIKENPNKDEFRYGNREMLNEIDKIVVDILINLDFPKSLIYYQYLTNERFDFLSRKKEQSNDSKKDKIDTITRNAELQKLLGIYYTILSVSKISNRRQEQIAEEFTLEFSNQFRKLLSYFKVDNLPNTIREIYGNILPLKDLEDENKYQTYKGLYYNYLSHILVDKVFRNGRIIPLQEKNEVYLDIAQNSKAFSQTKVILSIDKYNLWKDELSNPVKKYIVDRIEMLNRNKTNEIVYVNVEEFHSAYELFLKIYKGSSYTMAKELRDNINEFFGNHGSEFVLHKDEIDIDIYFKLLIQIRKLAFSRAWYGVKEALSMLSALSKSYLVFSYDNNYYLDDFIMWLHFYANNAVVDKDVETIYKLSQDMADFSTMIYKALENNNQAAVLSYKDQLAQDIEEELLVDFEKLFEINKKL